MPSANINFDIMDELRPHQDELLQLADLAGIRMDKEVFRSLIQLLNMGVSPEAVFNLLKNMRRIRTDPAKSRRSCPAQRVPSSKYK